METEFQKFLIEGATNMAFMDEKRFNEVIERQLELSRNTLCRKAGEYSIGGDRLHNFNQAARVDNESVEKAIWGMAKKHLSCVLDLVHGDAKPTEGFLDEKIGDFINYLLILKAHFMNEIQSAVPVMPLDKEI